MTPLTSAELLLRAQDDVDQAHHLWTDHPFDPTTLAHLQCRLEAAQAGALLAIGRILEEHFERVDNPLSVIDGGEHFKHADVPTAPTIPPSEVERLWVARDLLNSQADAEPHETMQRLRDLLAD